MKFVAHESELCDVKVSVGTVGIMCCGSFTFSFSVLFGVGCVAG